jgi:hypothetical protein
MNKNYVQNSISRGEGGEEQKQKGDKKDALRLRFRMQALDKNLDERSKRQLSLSDSI